MKFFIYLLIRFKRGLGLLFFILAVLQLPAQQSMHSMHIAAYNLSSFTPQLIYGNMEELSSINSQSDYRNPDFGIVAPGVNPAWYEQYGKRTATSRSFATEDGEVV